MNNFDILNNNRSIVRCKDCHWCVTGTYKNSDYTQHLCLRVIDHVAAIHVGENDFCEEGCLNRDETNLDLLENDNTVIRCKNCVWWDEYAEKCDYVEYTAPIDFNKSTRADCFCCHGAASFSKED